MAGLTMVHTGGTTLSVTHHRGAVGRTYVLVHGWGSSSASWDSSIHSLLAGGDVVTIDLRGHGASVAGAARACIPRLASDVIAVLEQLKLECVTLVGHSMGGNVVTTAALSEPRLVGSLIVIDPAYGADAHEMGRAPSRLQQYREVGAREAALAVEDGLSPAAPPSLAERVRADLLHASPRVLADSFESLYLAPESFGAVETAVQHLRLRRQPTLALYPTEGRASTERRIAAVSGPVWIRIAPVESHFLHEEAPGWFIDQVLEWTGSLDGHTDAVGI